MTSHLLPPDRRDDRWSYRQAGVFGALAAIVIAVMVMFPPQRLLGSVFGPPVAPSAVSRADGFGSSGEVRVLLKLPDERFDFPVEDAPARPGAMYQWVKAADSGAVTQYAALGGGTVISPPNPGFYHLAVTENGSRTILGDLTVAVMVPFDVKVGPSLNGYRIGTYTAEHARGGAKAPPQGFVEVWPGDADLWVTRHLQLADFLTHDGQQRWPRYVALDRRILDKVELVLEQLGGRYRPILVDVHSGFRTPLYNMRVPRAASDSRHQYGNAVDLALDADGDGRVSYFDILAIARAVDVVEERHPELVGGMGVYGNRGNAPYVHIDVRGERKRWRG